MTSIKSLLVFGLLIGSLTNEAQTLDSRQQSIVTISAFTATGDLVQLKKALHEGLDAGLTINEVKEVIVQLYAYAGFPRSLNAINTLETVVNERRQKGIKDVLGREPSKTVTTKTRFEVGKDVQTKLTGSTATGAPQRYVPIIDTFLKEHLFADIFSRDVLDWKTREIATIAALSSLSGTESQLQSHLNVGRNTGLTEEQLRSIASIISTKVKRTIFPEGEKITNNNFVGDAWVHQMVVPDSLHQTGVGSVTFEPRARSNWHFHPDGQILLAIDGLGYYQEKGSPKRLLRKGDVVKCPPNVEHWHGASRDQKFVQIAITSSRNGPVVWLQPVTEEEYFRQDSP